MALFMEINRSKFESTAYTVLLLAFFFAVGLAGGVLYRLLPNSTGEAVVAHAPTPPAASAPPVVPAAPVQTATAVTEPSAPVAKQAASPAKAATAKPAAPANAPATASVPLPDLAATTKPQAARSDAIAPIATEAATTVSPTSGEIAANNPATAKPAKPDAAASRPISAAKPATAAVKSKAPPEKRVAVAAPLPPLAGQPVPEGAAGPVRVQFGAYAIEDNAHQTQWAVEATGLAVEITQLRTPKGRVLFYVRSQPFADRAAAVSAATTAQTKAKGFVTPVAIDYVIVRDAAKPAQQAQVSGH